MASRMIGRATCPECGFESAHVKESEKCLYRYCPECGSQHYAKTTRQRQDLTAKTRTLPGATATPTGSDKPEPAAKDTPAPTADATATTSGNEPTATAPAKRRGLFS